MKVIVQFDAYAMDYEIKGEIGGLAGIDGVQSVSLLRKLSGDAPQFCLELQIADDKADVVREKLDRYRAQYAGQISNAAVTAYAVV